MEEIINKIIEIDNKAKAISADEKNRNQKIDDFIEEEFNKEKNKLNKQYEEEMKNQSQKYNALFLEKKAEIDSEVNNKTFQINEKFKKDEKNIIKHIVSVIKEGDNNV